MTETLNFSIRCLQKTIIRTSWTRPKTLSGGLSVPVVRHRPNSPFTHADMREGRDGLGSLNFEILLPKRGVYTGRVCFK